MRMVTNECTNYAAGIVAVWLVYRDRNRASRALPMRRVHTDTQWRLYS